MVSLLDGFHHVVLKGAGHSRGGDSVYLVFLLQGCPIARVGPDVRKGCCMELRRWPDAAVIVVDTGTTLRRRRVKRRLALVNSLL